MKMTVAELLRKLSKELTPLTGELAQSDAELIIEYSLNIPRIKIYTESTRIITNDELSRIESVLKRRLESEPLQYIFGKAYFYDREFIVNRDVLIPRPDTETLIETILNDEKGKKDAFFVDIGTGSGIIPTILTANNPLWNAIAIDISIDALKTASKNVSNRVKLLCADMLGAFKSTKKFDFIVSNPPYISSSQMNTLDKSVYNYEPHSALFGGDDGLRFYREISSKSPSYIKDGGRIYLEIGYDLGESVPQILRDDGWRNIIVIKDLAGRDRVVKAVYL
ncbi:MAG: peptide chain release factor N(5)-glutamine methyltransferase [Chitinispirillia bacterium]|nr:peptide chain release factor N(5)-glutamine methyltransferase [Chitinispirillia bacterium]